MSNYPIVPVTSTRHAHALTLVQGRFALQSYFCGELWPQCCCKVAPRPVGALWKAIVPQRPPRVHVVYRIAECHFQHDKSKFTQWLTMANCNTAHSLSIITEKQFIFYSFLINAVLLSLAAEIVEWLLWMPFTSSKACCSGHPANFNTPGMLLELSPASPWVLYNLLPPSSCNGNSYYFILTIMHICQLFI